VFFYENFLIFRDLILQKFKILSCLLIDNLFI
jgi:hypothetical protein